MKIILKEDIQNLGYKDDVVEVKNGYGRNYLIPQKKAILATESELKQLAEKLKQQANKLAKIKADAEASQQLSLQLANSLSLLRLVKTVRSMVQFLTSRSLRLSRLRV